MKDTHITLRLPLELARELAHLARARGVPRSQLVREAVTRQLAAPAAEDTTRRLTAQELATRWPHLPRLTPDEAAELAADVDAGRASLPTVATPWD